MKNTIIRLIVLVLVLINQILCSYGVINFEVGEEKIYEFVSIIATIVMASWTAWKNNSLTQNAKKADEYLKQLNGK